MRRTSAERSCAAVNKRFSAEMQRLNSVLQLRILCEISLSEQYLQKVTSLLQITIFVAACSQRAFRDMVRSPYQTAKSKSISSVEERSTPSLKHVILDDTGAQGSSYPSGIFLGPGGTIRTISGANIDSTESVAEKKNTYSDK